jgi:hypothetical protein
MWMTRPTPPTYAKWHAVNSEVPMAPGIRTGGAVSLRMSRRLSVELGQPAGPVVQPGTDRPYMGMDPSDPATYTRPYRPARGMIGWLNFDGAQPNKTQTVANPPRSWDQNRGRRRG